MLSNYHTFGYIVSDLQVKLANHSIKAAFSQEKHELVMSFQGVDGALILSCQRDVNTLYWHDKFARAKTNTADVMKGCRGEKVSSVGIPSPDRVIKMTLATGKAIVAQFFTGKANVFVVDSGNRIVDAFLKPNTFVGQQLVEHNGDVVYDVVGLGNKLRAIRKPILVALKNLFPTLGPMLCREVVFRSETSPETESANVNDEQASGIGTAMRNVFLELEKPMPRVYYREANGAEEMVAFSIVPLHHLTGLHERTFINIHEAIRFYISRRRARENFGDTKSVLSGKLGTHYNKLERRVKNKVKRTLQNWLDELDS